MAAAMTMAARMVLDMEITFIIWPTALPQEVQQPLVVQLELPRYGLMGALGEVYARPEHARMAALRGYDGLAPQVREEPLTEQTAVEEVYGAVHLTAPRTVEDEPRGTGIDVQGTRHAVAVALVEHASPHALAARHEAQARVLIVHYHRTRAPLAVGGELRHALAKDVCEAVEQYDVVLEHEGAVETALHDVPARYEMLHGARRGRGAPRHVAGEILSQKAGGEVGHVAVEHILEVYVLVGHHAVYVPLTVVIPLTHVEHERRTSHRAAAVCGKCCHKLCMFFFLD